MKKLLIVIIMVLMFALNANMALSYGWSTPSVTVNQSLQNTNGSNYWDNLDTFNTTVFREEPTGGILGIVTSWFNSIYVTIVDWTTNNQTMTNYIGDNNDTVTVFVNGKFPINASNVSSGIFNGGHYDINGYLETDVHNTTNLTVSVINPQEVNVTEWL